MKPAETRQRTVHLFEMLKCFFLIKEVTKTLHYLVSFSRLRTYIIVSY